MYVSRSILFQAANDIWYTLFDVMILTSTRRPQLEQSSFLATETGKLLKPSNKIPEKILAHLFSYNLTHVHIFIRSCTAATAAAAAGFDETRQRRLDTFLTCWERWASRWQQASTAPLSAAYCARIFHSRRRENARPARDTATGASERTHMPFNINIINDNRKKH